MKLEAWSNNIYMINYKSLYIYLQGAARNHGSSGSTKVAAGRDAWVMCSSSREGQLNAAMLCCVHGSMCICASVSTVPQYQWEHVHLCLRINHVHRPAQSLSLINLLRAEWKSYLSPCDPCSKKACAWPFVNPNVKLTCAFLALTSSLQSKLERLSLLKSKCTFSTPGASIIMQSNYHTTVAGLKNQSW